MSARQSLPKLFPVISAAVVLIMLTSCRACNSSDDAKPYIEKGDLAKIKERGKLRIIVPATEEAQTLPRKGPPLDYGEELARQFAEELGIKPVMIYVDRFEDLLPKLINGDGDIVAANLTVTDQRKKRVAFSAPLTLVHEQVVTRYDDDSIERRSDLEGRTFAVRRSSSYFRTLQDLQRKYPGINTRTVDETLDTEQIIHKVGQGQFDLTLADSNVVERVLRYEDGVKIALNLTADQPLAWAVRPDANELLKQLNAFLDREKIAESGGTYTDDLPRLKELKSLRVLTRNTASTYFLWRGKLVGFEYDLTRQFAKEQGLHVKIIVPPAQEDLIPWLKEGRGDIIAAGMTITENRQQMDGIDFSTPYNYVREMLVARADEEGLDSPEDLAGRTVVVRENSSYYQTLAGLVEKGIDFRIEKAPVEMETEEIIHKVAQGDYDLTVADSNILGIELTYRDDIKGAFPLTEELPQGWIVRADNPQLLGAVNKWISSQYRGLFYNVTYNKYFTNKRKIARRATGRPAKGENLSPYDEYVKDYARQYNFDWRLITSQMYQESRFDPNAVSWAGAIGLMQVMPQTAHELGFTRFNDPAEGIHAGVKYLYRMRSRFPTSLEIAERVNFALASYNVGYGHVLDARRLAEDLGLDEDVWFNNVETAMLKLTSPKYYRNARFGYCRGSEPVQYVQQIRNRYNAYLNIVERTP